jgi:signal-transduction protein with cAMP-binding, CBS, and nucleotidyltransferase domain
MPRSLREEFPTISEIAYREYRKHTHVADVMTTTVLTTTPEVTMEDAAKIMGDRHIGSLVVTEKGAPSGIVTERDLLSKVIARDKDPARVRVREVMSTRLITVKPTDTIKDAAQTMINEKGRLIVLREGRAAGIITASDLIRTLPKIPETMIKVEDVMTRKVVAVEPKTPVRGAAKMMGEMRIGSVLVKDSGKLEGIFTERDLLTKVLARRLSLETRTGELASKPLLTIPLGSSIHRTALTMASRHIRRLPVAKDGDILGIVTARDLVEAYSR